MSEFSGEMLMKELPLDAIVAEARRPISNEWLVSIASNQDNFEFPGIITNNRDSKSIKTASCFTLPSSLYGHQYAKNMMAVWNLRPECGMDLFCTDELGLLRNKIENVSFQDRIETAQKEKAPIIFFFGCSTAMSMGARTPDFSIPALLERVSCAKYDKKVCVINFALGGTDSRAALSLLVSKALKLSKPDAVVFYGGWNDCSYMTTTNFAMHQQRSLNKPVFFEGETVRHIEHNCTFYNMYNYKWLFSRSIELVKAECVQWLRSNFNNKLARMIADRLQNFCSDLRPDAFFNWKKMFPSTDEEIASAASKAAFEYLYVCKLAKHICEAEQILFFPFLQPLTFWGCKPLTMQEKTWRDSGYSSGRPKIFYAFKNALDEHMRDEKINSYLKINDLTDVFDSLTEQVYIDTGHVSRVGNVMIAERIADTLHKKI